MTCFATPEFLNRRLSNYEYISHPADIEFFAALIRDIRKMERHGDNLDQVDSRNFAAPRLVARLSDLRSPETAR